MNERRRRRAPRFTVTRLVLAAFLVAALLFVGWREVSKRERNHRSAQAARATAIRAGRQIFVSTCQECHTVVGHETQPRGGGGDLGIGKFSVAEEESFAAIMPIYPPLTTIELRDVALYVIERQRHFAQAPSPAR